ncbi:hypothetical protein O181_096983 [Austropuccinia psidii MF-1]|uniref:Uncharacterized protein n=1 Tax=Austropuccinia psidii MF-1 TaxID=1389203 RepID=A0A9Q3PCQ7_9BASI|nr:hypothetical protein [Austropuccinia psidii MF-1]
MSPVHLRNLRVPRTQEKERPGLFRNIGSGSRHHGGWKNTQENHANAAIHLPAEQEPQTRGLEGYGSSF